ncbi:MAG TPA: alpha/beta fold hydrolase [Thermoleophilaceae bacterium]|nr:alpha/beta fold hydrolase [Thermoleophilaceae bacterium]
MSKAETSELGGTDAHSTPPAGPPSAPQSVPRRRRWPRRALVALAVAIVLLAGLGAAASWHYSSDVVVPDHSGWPYDVDVRGTAAGRVTLERDEDTERPGVYGLEWEGGHAILGRVVDRDPETVTRRMRAVRGTLRGGDRARIYSKVFHGDPRSARDLPFEPVAVRSQLGPMPAWRIGGRARTWAIFVHGINDDRLSGLRIAPALRAAGLTSLLISYRDDVGAPPSPDGKHHMGLTEWRDLEAAARFALDHGARRLVLVGYSMGGAIVTQFMERSPLAPRVAGMVLDAPALDWAETIEFGARKMGLPSVAAKPVEWAIGLRIDVDWDRLDALRHTDRLAVPTLLFHGLDDDVVPIATSAALARALPRQVELERVPHAGHVESWNVAPARYEARVRAFLVEAVSAAP